jgi:hypothetical protein
VWLNQFESIKVCFNLGMLKFLPVLLVVSLYFLVPSGVEAVELERGLVTCSGTNCGSCELVEMGNVIILWLFGLVGMVFAVMMMIAGFGLITSRGNTSALEAAKSKFVNAVIGLLIMMSAWLLIDFMMKSLLVGESLSAVSTGWGPWNQVQCTLQTVTLPGQPGAPTEPAMGAPGRLTHAQASALLTAAGISVSSSGNCSDPNNPRCTGLEGIQQGTIDRMLAINRACPACRIRMTAGTEVGHSNACHRNGACSDINCTGGCTTPQIITINEAANQNSGRVVFETTNCALRDTVRAAGVTAYCKSDRGYGHITGDHFSIYGR